MIRHAQIRVQRVRGTSLGRIRALPADRRGSLVEFGIVGSMFIGLLIAIVQICYLLLQQSELDRLTDMVMRQVQIGSQQSGGVATTGQLAQTLMCKADLIALNCNSVIVNIGRNPTSSAIFATPPWITSLAGQGTQQFCLGSGGSYVFVQLLYPSAIFAAPWIGASAFVTAGGRKVSVLESRGLFRVEPSVAQASGSC